MIYVILVFLEKMTLRYNTLCSCFELKVLCNLIITIGLLWYTVFAQFSQSTCTCMLRTFLDNVIKMQALSFTMRCMHFFFEMIQGHVLNTVKF